MAKKRADGRLQKGFTFNGRRYYVYGLTKSELAANERKKRAELEAGIERRENPTVSQYYERWTQGRRGTIKESTLRGQIKMYEAISAVYIPDSARTFGELKIKDVSVDDLRTVQAVLLQSRRTQTVNDYLAHFAHCMGDAFKERVIEYNPCGLLHPLKRTEELARDTHHRALTLQEQRAFFECERCKSSFYFNVFRFAVCTGMRIGEIGALKFTDIRDGMIHVERTITRSEAGNHFVGDDAKTKAGKRQIPINSQIAEIIQAQKEINILLDGNVTPIDGLIFRAPERGLLMSTPADREIRRICNACGVEPFTMHAFRATFATRCIESGMNPKTLQEILGHANFNITMSLYGHALADTKKAAMEAVKIAI